MANATHSMATFARAAVTRFSSTDPRKRKRQMDLTAERPAVLRAEREATIQQPRSEARPQQTAFAVSCSGIDHPYGSRLTISAYLARSTPARHHSNKLRSSVCTKTGRTALTQLGRSRTLRGGCRSRRASATDQRILDGSSFVARAATALHDPNVFRRPAQPSGWRVACQCALR
jgi:hypothetical protein